MFGNGEGPPTVTREELPKLHEDHDEFRQLLDARNEVESELEELKADREELLEVLRRWPERRPSRDERLDDILSGERSGRHQLSDVQERELDLRREIRRRERDLEVLRSERRSMEVPASRDLCEREDVQARYEEIVEGMHAAACELARWADAEVRFRDALSNNGVRSSAALGPCAFPAAQCERRHVSPMKVFLRLCRDRHGLDPDGLDISDGRSG